MKVLSTLSIFVMAVAGYTGLTSFTVSPVNPSSAVYDAQFLSHQQAGSNFEWTWAVSNPNPGNGKNGSLQDLSHWSVAVPEWLSYDDIVAVEYSLDNITWTTLHIQLGTDPSQSCYDGNVIKFDAGTSGTATTYYR